MMHETSNYDAVVIGGGFYGATIAAYLVQNRKFRKVLLIEREFQLMSRASYHNQARVHNGYHYPRSFTTAYRSRINLPRFVKDWPQAVSRDFIKLYAIARKGSKVTARQFTKFCREIGASIEPASPEHRKLFSPQLIEDVFRVEEYAFDATKLADWARLELASAGVVLAFETRAIAIDPDPPGRVRIRLSPDAGSEYSVTGRFVFNCTYSGLKQFESSSGAVSALLKHEVTEMALVSMPESLQRIGITVMDGPFFSVMPFPARNLHTLSHVRYTPHFSWIDKPFLDPYKRLGEYECASRVDRMIRDVRRYIPELDKVVYKESLFEIKTVLASNEADDGRPILFEKHDGMPGCFSILGGKIDNIYDILEMLDEQTFDLSQTDVQE